MPYDKLLELADKLESVSPEKFTYNNWIYLDFLSQRARKDQELPKLLETESCGTKGCALGWCTVFWPEYWRFSSNEEPVKKTSVDVPSRWNPYRAASEFFGIADSEAEDLFCPGDEEENFTPYQVAEKIREFVTSKTASK